MRSATRVRGLLGVEGRQEPVALLERGVEAWDGGGAGESRSQELVEALRHLSEEGGTWVVALPRLHRWPSRWSSICDAAAVSPLFLQVVADPCGIGGNGALLDWLERHVALRRELGRFPWRVMAMEDEGGKGSPDAGELVRWISEGGPDAPAEREEGAPGASPVPAEPGALAAFLHRCLVTPSAGGRDGMEEAIRLFSRWQALFSGRGEEGPGMRQRLRERGRRIGRLVEERRRLGERLRDLERVVIRESGVRRELTESREAFRRKLELAEAHNRRLEGALSEAQRFVRERESEIASLLDRVAASESACEEARGLALERLARMEQLEQALEAAREALSEAQRFVRQRESEIGAIRSRLEETSAALESARELVKAREKEAAELRTRLDSAEDACRQASDLAVERLERIERLEEALSEAQRLAWERLDRMGELERALDESRARAAGCEGALQDLTERTERLKRHPLWRLIQRITGTTL